MAGVINQERVEGTVRSIVEGYQGGERILSDDEQAAILYARRGTVDGDVLSQDEIDDLLVGGPDAKGLHNSSVIECPFENFNPEVRVSSRVPERRYRHNSFLVRPDNSQYEEFLYDGDFRVRVRKGALLGPRMPTSD